MKALIFNEKVIQLSEREFEVHPSLIWRDAPEGCNTDWVYNPDTDIIGPPEDSIKTIEEILKEYQDEISDLLRQTAISLNYDDEVTLVSYANSNNEEWRLESLKYIAWRDTVWESAISTYNKVQNGDIEVMPINDFINALPKFESF